MKRAMLLALLFASTAQADVWKRAIDGKDDSLAKTAYDHELSDADDLVVAANSKMASLPTVKSLIDQAVAGYKRASAIRPTEAEPYFRIGTVLENFYFCARSPVLGLDHPTCETNPAKAKEAIDAWDKFEAMAPLDPRVTSVLSRRAILRTKMVTLDPTNKKLLEGARDDYKALIDRADSVTLNPQIHSTDLVYGNYAETVMMLGDLETAIDAYRMALSRSASVSMTYGYAVALDRDDRSVEAMAVIRDLGTHNFDLYKKEIMDHFIFYVPDGEVEYYLGLVEETFDNYDQAIVHWRAFIASGAHPQYQPRAKEHLAALLKRRNARPVTPPPDPFGDLR